MSDSAKKLVMQTVFVYKPTASHLSKGTGHLGSTVHPHTSSSVPAPGVPSVLIVSVENCRMTGVAESTIRSIWKKAEVLVKTHGHIIKVPWSDDQKDRLIKSSSSTQPHLVTRDPENQNLY